MQELMFSSFPKKTKLNVLDFGCGNGYLYSIFPKAKLKKYTGFDVNSNAIQTAKRRVKFKNVSLNLIDPEKPLNLGVPNSKDVVIAIGVLQYLSDKDINAFIDETKRVLKKQGVLLISTVSDHYVYRALSIYRFFLPNRLVNRNKLLNKIKKTGFTIDYQREIGLFLGPLVSHNLTLFPDALDKLIFSTKGTLGFFGRTFRRLVTPLMYLEYLIPIDYGYTLYIKARKK